MKKITGLLLAVIVGIAGFEYSCTNDQQTKIADESTKTLTAADVHLGAHMRDIQYNTLKLGISLQHQNQPLASFYVHEVEEAYAELADKKIEEEGIDISTLLNQLLDPKLKELQSVIEKNDTAQFITAYQTLIQTCNSCHREAKHAFIVIEMPKQDYNGQNFNAAP